MSSSFLHALGLMSGTSVDGVDVALIETDGERLASFGPVLTVPYADDVRRLIRAAFGAEQPNDATAAAEQAVTEAHRVEVRLCHRLLGGGRRVVRLLCAEGRADQATHIVGIGNGEDRAERGEPLAVGLDEGDIDAVDRGPAHQAEGMQKGR